MEARVCISVRLTLTCAGGDAVGGDGEEEEACAHDGGPGSRGGSLKSRMGPKKRETGIWKCGMV